MAAACAAVAVVAAVLGLVVTDGVPGGAVVTTAAAVLAAVALQRLRGDSRGDSHGQLRGVLQGVGVLGALATLAWSPQVVADRGALGIWPVLASAVAVRQFAVARTAREVRAVLGLAVLVTVAAAGVSPTNALVGPAVLVSVAALAGTASSVPHRPADRVQVRRTVLGVSAASTAALVLFLLVPTPQGGRALGSAELAASARALGADGAPGDLGAADRSAQAYAGGTLDTSARGELPDTPLLSVPVGSPELWRSAVLDAYDGRTWTATSPATPWTARAGATRWSTPVPDGASRDERTDAVQPLADYPALAAPGLPVGVATTAGVRADAAVTHLTPAGTTYEITSRVVPSVDDEGLRAVGSVGPVDAQRWSQLPVSVPARVRDLGVRLAAGGDAVTATRAVAAYLRANARYSVDSPVPAPGRDAVDAFLFTDRVGFCEQFAAAEVVLLRSAGFPARLVTGLAGGTESGGSRVLRAEDAHAWVEVWVPGTGWVSSDPTAGTAAAGSGAGSSAWARLWSWVQSAGAAVLAGPGLRYGLAGALLVVAALAWWLAWWLVRRAGRDAAAVPVAAAERRADPAVAALLLAVRRWDAAVPVPWRRGAAEGVSAWRDRLVAAGPQGPAGALGGAWDAVPGALAVVERACYGRELPPRAELDGARAALEAASSAVLALRAGAGAGGAGEAR
nr:transglutaminase domain-containing protein [Kineococcus aurantiacus]